MPLTGREPAVMLMMMMIMVMVMVMAAKATVMQRMCFVGRVHAALNRLHVVLPPPPCARVKAPRNGSRKSCALTRARSFCFTRLPHRARTRRRRRRRCCCCCCCCCCSKGDGDSHACTGNSMCREGGGGGLERKLFKSRSRRGRRG